MTFFWSKLQPKLNQIALALLTTMVCIIISSSAAELSGSATVIDGDTLRLGGQPIRLAGIDAPELRQPCRQDGTVWYPGLEAKGWLAAWLATGPIDCVTSGHNRERLLAHCRRRDGQDIGQAIVAAGWAFAYRQYSDRYVSDEEHARASGDGIWRGACDRPWVWRKGRSSG